MKAIIKCRVVMLPHMYNKGKTVPANTIVKKMGHSKFGFLNSTIDTNHLRFTGNPIKAMFVDTSWDWQLQHLYFVTDYNLSVPVKGDYVFDGKQVYRYNDDDDFLINDSDPESILKVVASTDMTFGIPEVPLHWVKDIFIPSNNNNITITQVDFETDVVGD